MKFSSLVALLLLSLVTMTLGQDDVAVDVEASTEAVVVDVAAEEGVVEAAVEEVVVETVEEAAVEAVETPVVECDCASEIEAQMSKLVAARDSLSVSVADSTSQHQILVTKLQECSNALSRTTSTNQSWKVQADAEFATFHKDVSFLAESVAAEYEELREELRATKAAIKVFQQRAEETETHFMEHFSEANEKKEEVLMYTRQHRTTAEEIYHECIVEMKKPGPLVNTTKIWEDVKKIFKSLSGSKKEDDSKETETTSPEEDVAEVAAS